MSLVADLHARGIEQAVEQARLYREAALAKRELAMFRKHGSLMRVKPGLMRPRLVRVESWGETGANCNRGFALVRCIESNRRYVFPLHQLTKPCWRCHGSRSVYAPRSRKHFPCPACAWRVDADERYPPNLRKILGREGPAAEGF